MSGAFDLAAVAVMGLIGAGVLWLAPASAHDVCLAIVSGLAGALTGAAKAARNPQP
jgi:hypothetical protein